MKATEWHEKEIREALNDSMKWANDIFSDTNQNNFSDLFSNFILILHALVKLPMQDPPLIKIYNPDKYMDIFSTAAQLTTAENIERLSESLTRISESLENIECIVRNVKDRL